MRPLQTRLTRIAFVMAALAGVLAAPARAQYPATRVGGSAVSTTGERIVGAQVNVIGSANAAGLTDEDGKFEIFVLNDSVPRLVVRRIGFRPETLTVRLPQAAAPLVVRMSRTVQMVRPVVVNATSMEANTVLASVRARERTGGNGHFTYRSEFMRSNPVKFTDILRRVPGVTFSKNRTNNTEVRLRNARCSPLYWIDNQPLLGMPFDPDVLPPGTIEAIEVYSSATLVPPQFQGPSYAQGCGAIVIWTRQGERPVRRPKIGADSIARLLDAHRLFLVSEVDQPARIISIHEPEYPDSLRAAGVGGSAVVEFIVDADGKVDKESIGTVSATHVKFADAVRIAVLDATFLAAKKDGRDVAQIYQLPVTFNAPRP
jgi:TonB family protein